jgi:transposase
MSAMRLHPEMTPQGWTATRSSMRFSARGVDLDAGQTADWVMAQECVSLIPGIKELLAGKGYDTDAFRASSKTKKSSRSSRVNPTARCSSGTTRAPTRIATVIERCFGRLKDFRRIATRYDKLAGNFFSALRLVAIVAYRL